METKQSASLIESYLFMPDEFLAVFLIGSMGFLIFLILFLGQKTWFNKNDLRVPK